MKEFIWNKKLAIVLCVVFLVLLIGGHILFNSIQQKNTVTHYKQNLQMLAEEKALQLEQFFESQKEELVILGSMEVFKEAVLHPEDASKIRAANETIQELKGIIPGMALLTNEGIIVIGEIDPPGTDYSSLPAIASDGEDVMFVRYYDQTRKKDYYAVGGPLYDTQDKTKMIGIVSFDIDLERVSAIMKESVDTRTNEVYLIDSDGLMLSNSEYIGKENKNGVLTQQVRSEEAEHCLEDLKIYGKDSIIEEHKEETFQHEAYLNYMGNEVFGAHAYVPAIMGCVIAEIHAEEILEHTTAYFIKELLNPKEGDEDED